MVTEILEPKTEEVTTGELNCIMSSFIIWLGYVARMGQMWSENPKQRDNLGDLDEGGKIILKLFLKNRMGGCELKSSGSGCGL
jgi:hypothetical protein